MKLLTFSVVQQKRLNTCCSCCVLNVLKLNIVGFLVYHIGVQLCFAVGDGIADTYLFFYLSKYFLFFLHYLLYYAFPSVLEEDRLCKEGGPIHQ